jgi:Leucine-rich repeat (LRR) protein
MNNKNSNIKKFLNEIERQIIKSPKKFIYIKKGLTKLPPNIGQYIQFEYLILGENELTSLPPEIGNLTNLKILSLEKNKLKSLPDEICNLRNLNKLILQYNNLKSLPRKIGFLTNLNELWLNNNKLFSLPRGIGQLKNLKVLNLSSNNLRFLPEEIDQLKNLETLNLSSNNLHSLPKEIGNLKKLNNLILDRKNNLTSLPPTFKKLNDNLIVTYNDTKYSKKDFIKLFVIINKNTEFIQSNFITVGKMRNINQKNLGYININSEFKGNDRILRRVYNITTLKNKMLESEKKGSQMSMRLHGGNFSSKNIKLLKNFPHFITKGAYLNNIKNRLSKVPLNSLMTEVENIKQKLPSNVSRNDVNKLFNKMKPEILKKIRNKLKINNSNNRARIINNMKRMRIINNNDIKNLNV